jgi:putative Ig domain-containing protein
VGLLLPGLVINPSTGQLTGTIPPSAAALSPYMTTIEPTDGSNSGVRARRITSLTS